MGMQAKGAKKEKKKKAKAEQNSHESESEQLRLETRPQTYLEELTSKVASMKELLHGFGASPLPEAEVFQSPREHFRMRIELDISHTDDGPVYVMHAGKKQVVVHEFPMCSTLICDKLMPGVLQALREEPDLRQHLFQVNFHATLCGDAMVSLLYR